jgi:two-component system, NtrC family, response regulator AtoC
VFAKTSRERDYWRNILAQKNVTVLFFEKETIFFDNLKSLNARAIILITDSNSLVWRFIFALNACNADARLIIISNTMTDNFFQLYGSPVSVNCFSDAFHMNGLCPPLWESIDAGLDAEHKSGQELFIGLSPAIRGINAALPGLVKNGSPVLISGEDGTGKELLARMIANHTGTDSIFIKVSCSDLAVQANDNGYPPSQPALDHNGLLESLQALISGNTATVLFDNINKMDLDVQSEMLTFLDKGFESNPGQDHHLRIIATTEEDLEGLVGCKRFRKDLYYRLNVIPLHLPPLRQRRQDIPLLMDHFIIGECARLGRSFLIPSEQAAGWLYGYHWPGNLEELRRAMRRFAASGDETQLFKHTGIPLPGKESGEYLALTVEMESLLDPVRIQNCLPALGSMSLKSISDQFVHRTEKKLLRKALESTNWNRKKAAALLSISYKSMLNKMKHYELI